MEKIVDVERLNRHLSELKWSPTVEISRDELIAVLARLEQAEQAVQRVREVATDDPTEYGWSEAMLAVLRALDGDGRE